MRFALKSAFVATAVLFSASNASAQQHAKLPERLDVNQFIDIIRTDAGNADIILRLEDGTILKLKVNTFILADLSRKLGNYRQ